jgi:hypothetical protein
MKNVNEKLSEVLEIEPISIETDSVQELIPVEAENDILENDFSFARENLKKLITKGAAAIDDILFVAKESEHPRAYEVASAFLKNLSEMNKDLLELQKAKKDVLKQNSRQVNDPSITVQKAVFIGSTNELNKLLKAQKEEE